MDFILEELNISENRYIEFFDIARRYRKCLDRAQELKDYLRRHDFPEKTIDKICIIFSS